jgi:hypothetical protein
MSKETKITNLTDLDKFMTKMINDITNKPYGSLAGLQYGDAVVPFIQVIQEGLHQTKEWQAKIKEKVVIN